MDMTVRIEKISDYVDTLLDLSITTFTETFSEQNTKENMRAYMDEALTRPKFMREFENPESEFYFLYENEAPVGFLKVNVGAAQSEEMGADALEVERIYLLASTKGKGYGRMLIQKAETIAQTKGKTRIWLSVWEYNQSAIKFYEKMGFKICGEHVFRMGDDPQTDYIMEKFL